MTVTQTISRCLVLSEFSIHDLQRPIPREAADLLRHRMCAGLWEPPPGLVTSIWWQELRSVTCSVSRARHREQRWAEMGTEGLLSPQRELRWFSFLPPAAPPAPPFFKSGVILLISNSIPFVTASHAATISISPLPANLYRWNEQFNHSVIHHYCLPFCYYLNSSSCR